LRLSLVVGKLRSTRAAAQARASAYSQTPFRDQENALRVLI